MKRILHRLAKLPLWQKIVGAALIALVVIFGVRHFGATSAPAQTAQEPTHVTVSSVASLSDSSAPLPVTGKVTSVSKASILAVSSGEIVSLSRSLGDYVPAGGVIASFENSSQRAAVLQAQGAYEGAQAALAKARGTTAQNSTVTSAQATQSAQNAILAANTALRSAYVSLDDAVHTKADALFSNPHSSSPQLNLTVSDGQVALDAQNQRVQLDALIESVRLLSVDQNTNVNDLVVQVISKSRTVEAFLDRLVDALNSAVTTSNVSATTIASYQSSVSAARSEVLATISSLTSAKAAYESAVSGATVAQNSANSSATNDIASAEAAVKSALGALNAAQANLEKTIIRAPISGTIVSLPITRGGYVSAFSQVAQISNPNALNIEAYVTSEDAKTLVVGGKASINGSVNGVIVFIAPALDPTTGKIQVKVGLSGDQRALTDGDTVTVSLERSATGGGKGAGKKEITIPIAAAKITPEGPVVFTVSSSTLVAHPVVFGAIVGGQVAITSGVSLDMDIVTDARGLSDGQRVIVDIGK